MEINGYTFRQYLQRTVSRIKETTENRLRHKIKYQMVTEVLVKLSLSEAKQVCQKVFV